MQQPSVPNQNRQSGQNYSQGNLPLQHQNIQNQNM